MLLIPACSFLLLTNCRQAVAGESRAGELSASVPEAPAPPAAQPGLLAAEKCGFMAEKRYSNVAGFDDAPFERDHEGGVKIVGTVYAGLRFDGVLIGEVEKDGFNASAEIARLVEGSRFAGHIQLIMLQGIALAGFNVVDVFDLYERLGLPVLVVSRREPDMDKIKRALNEHINQGEKKWSVIQRLREMEPLNRVFVQRVGLSRDQAESLFEQFAVHGNIPEPLRTAHMIAGAIVYGQSRGSV